MNLTTPIEIKPSFSLGIADFTIRINCNHEHLTNILSERYADFPPMQKPTFTALVEWVGKERRSSLLDTKASFQDDILHFSAPGYQGFINEKIGRGYLQLSSAHPIEDIDYYLRVVLALLVNQVGGILMHTAGIVRNQQAHLFFGHSGSGKSTVCQESLKGSSADEFQILNDDLILMIPKENGWLAQGTPFWNPTQTKPSNKNATVAGMYLLIQDTRVFKQKLSPGKATAALISNIPIIPQDPVRSSQLLEILSQLQKSTSVCELHFLPDNSFWDVISS